MKKISLLVATVLCASFGAEANTFSTKCTFPSEVDLSNANDTAACTYVQTGASQATFTTTSEGLQISDKNGLWNCVNLRNVGAGITLAECYDPDNLKDVYNVFLTQKGDTVIVQSVAQ